ncbi:amino acid adenylation domain-containing protein [Micromonospora sp. FIMYZ51]|uniref:amino acid adenylation domain-containing protein n=1 Tax=Micromonospora sp. FIMYZ51 TaxID=3051832 RepID=UPI00311E2145
MTASSANPAADPADIDTLRADIATHLAIPPEQVGDHDDLLYLGLDSIGVMRLANRWRRYGPGATFAELIERRTLAEWAALVFDKPSAPPATQSPATAPPATAPPTAVPTTSATAPAPATTAPSGEPFALSTMQHAYWVGRGDGQVLGGVGAHFYNEFDGAGVDPERLDRACRALTARHAMLRARFLDDGRQQIDPDGRWPGLTVHDLRALDGPELDQRLAEIRDRMSHARLAVERGEVLTLALSLLPGGACRIHLHIEMLVADAESFRILLRDLAQLYRQDQPLPPLNYDYQRYLTDVAPRRAAERDRVRDYWLARLDTMPAGPQLPLSEHATDGPASMRRGHWIDADGWQTLGGHARGHGLTLSIVFLTAFVEVLAAWSEQPNFLVNIPLYNREEVHPEVGDLVGDFTNLVLLEADATEPATFVQRARAVQERLRADIQHAAFTGVDVLRELSRRAGTPVLAPVVFTSALSLGELFADDVRQCFGRPGYTMSQTPQVWLDVQVTEREGGLFVNWDSAERQFADGVLTAMFAAYTALLARLTDRPESWTVPVDGLLPAAQREVRHRVNDTAAPVPADPIHAPVFARAANEPDGPALLWGDDGRMSRGELTHRARCVAARLVEHGVTAGDLVAVCLPKGPDQVVAVLGVLAAGATYVPVGPDQPARRRDRILTDAGVRVAVAATGSTLPVPVVDPAAAVAAGRPLDRPVVPDPAQPAYVIFTSGSTGTPKGVVVSHRAAANTIEALNKRFGIGPADRVLAVSALDFDLSVYDIFGLLGAGGAVVLVGETERRAPEAWAALVRRHGVTVWQSVPALLDMLLTVPADLGDSPRLAIVGGDWVDPRLPERFTGRFPGARFAGLGGTTEAAIHSTVCEVAVSPGHWRSVPYGVPLPNVRCTVTDVRGDDRPDLVTGELWIGGVSLADGYLGDPARTASRFVTRAGQRWYRTGDLARYWPDGTIEVLGRTDQQVKILGHRIDLGEVEAALLAHPEVRLAVACVLSGTTTRLAAAVAADAVDPGELRDFVADRLPAAMVPVRIEIRPQLPLSPNGKLDRAAIRDRILAEPTGEPGRASGVAAPRGPVEAAVATVWSTILGVPEVGRDDNFFLLGGDSLLATRIIARLPAAGVVGAGLSDLLTRPTLAEFAARLRVETAVAAPAALTADPEHRFDPFPATDVQRAYWLGRGDEFALGGVGSHWYWEFDGTDVDIARLERAFNTLIGRHDMLRVVFEPDGRQRVLPTLPWQPITVHPADTPLAALRAAASTRIPDPASAPPVHIWARSADGQTRIGFSFDYIALDAFSIVSFFGELATLYRDPQAALPPVGITFRDYVTGVAIPAEERRAAEAYWSQRLDQIPGPPELPLRVDPAQLAAPVFRRRSARIAPEQWRAITAQCRASGVTPAAVLLTAYAETLSGWSGGGALTVNLTLFDRRDVHPDIDRVFGDFTSLLLVAHHPVAGEALLDTVRRVQRQMWADMEHRAASGIWVMRELGRRAGRAMAGMPVVFTSALGLSGELTGMTFPFGDLVWGISQTPQVWLDCQVMEQDGGLAVNWDAVEDLFPTGVLDAMFAAYVELIHRLAGPAWSVPVPALLPAAQRQVRTGVNATDAERADRPLHADFFATAQAHPDRLALLGPGPAESVTYGDLAARAMRLAGRLAAAGLTPGDPVAVTLRRGVGQVVAVLGILAAGGVYVPVGLAAPPARRHDIYRDAGVRLVVIDGDTAPDGPGAATPESGGALSGTGDGAETAGGWSALALHDDDTGPDGPLAGGPVPVDPAGLAYVIYTSGSTGTPKGVEIEHRAAVNTLDDLVTRIGLGPDDRVLAVSALDFDLSVFDIFALLGVGGAVVLLDEARRSEPTAWLRAVAEHGVTIWNSVPALLDMALVTAAATRKRLASVRVALVSGDWVGLDLRERFTAAGGGRLIALGGATEAAIWSNAYEVTGVPADWRSIPYGFPLRNQRFRVVDERGRDCPDWVGGELWIGGSGVARGYRNDAERTARQFVNVDGQRWYRTGDQGRYWADGTLEFLGRRDSQVKLGGHRLELGEVEVALRTHPGVAAALAAVTGQGAARQLVAGIVAEPTAAPVDVDAVVVAAARRLPEYAVPARVVLLDALPLTGNGKVDRVRLAELVQPPETAPDDGPATALEKELAGLWERLLDVRGVGRDTNFFAIGGDSITATRLVAELHRRFGVEIALRRLMDAATVARLAAVVAEQYDEADIEDGVL